MQSGIQYYDKAGNTVDIDAPAAVETYDWFARQIGDGLFKLQPDGYFESEFAAGDIAGYVSSVASAPYVEGAVEGEIDLKGAVIVTTTGCVHGPISADVIHVAGSVEGNVVARDHLRLEKSGTLEGDAETVSLVVEDGGRLNGRTTMMKQDGTPKPRPKEDLQFGRNYKAEEEEEGAQ